MKPSIAAKLASLDSRLKEIDARLANPEVVNDLDNYRKLSQERAEIEPVVAAFNEQADLRLGAGIAQEHPPATIEIFFGRGHESLGHIELLIGRRNFDYYFAQDPVLEQINAEVGKAMLSPA